MRPYGSGRRADDRAKSWAQFFHPGCEPTNRLILLSVLVSGASALSFRAATCIPPGSRSAIRSLRRMMACGNCRDSSVRIYFVVWGPERRSRTGD